MTNEFRKSVRPRRQFEERHGKVVSKSVDASLITHFRAENKYTIAYHPNGEVLLNDTLLALAEEFGNEFIRCHKSILVRRSFIEGLTSIYPTCILQVVGVPEGIRVSRRHRAEILEILKIDHHTNLLKD